MADRDVANLAAAVADGDAIDWPAVQSRLSAPEDLDVAEGLQTLSCLTAALSGVAAHPRSLRLTPLLEFARGISSVCCLVGLLGFVGLIRNANPGRFAVMLAVLVTFAGTASYLDVGGQDRRARALATCFWTTAAAFSARGIFWLLQSWPDSLWLQALMALRPEAFFAAALWQFAREFPAVTRFSKFDGLCLIALRIALTIAVALAAANLLPLVAPGSVFEGWVAPFQRLTGNGAGFWNPVFGMAIAAVLAIAWRGRSATGAERARVRVFLYAIGFSIAPVMTEVVAQGLFPSYGRFRQTPEGFLGSALFVYPPMFLLPAATAYAVAVPNVLEVRVVIQRGLRYLLARWVAMWGAAAPPIILFMLLYQHADQPLDKTLATRPAAILLWLSAMGIALLACRRALIRALDRWALPGAEDASAMLAQMTERMKHARTPLEVTSALARAAERTLQAPARAYLYIDGMLVPAGRGPKPPRQSVISVLLEGSREPCIVSAKHRQSYYPLMTDPDREWIDTSQVEVIVPVLSGGSRNGLLGVVTLGGRKNALWFSQDDLRFLRAGAASASLACSALTSERQKESGSIEEVALQCTRCGQVEEWTSKVSLCSCGGLWEPAVLPKRVASRLEIHQRLGSGGMGVVYRATDLTLGREVAVKTLPRLSEDASTRLMHEARTMASLSHSDVAVLFAAERWHGTPLLIMEYLSGGTLAARLRTGPLLPQEAVRIVRLLARTLERLHQANLYHGDIKPSNIGFATDGAPKLLDFGLTRAVFDLSSSHGDEAATGSPSPGLVGGTLAYLSPEVRQGALPGPALDLWALSVVLCESLLGKHPFSSARTASELLRGVADAMVQVRRLAAPALGGFLEASLSPVTSCRPSTAAEFGNALEAIGADTYPKT